jgi:hypothetical protein
MENLRRAGRIVAVEDGQSRPVLKVVDRQNTNPALQTKPHLYRRQRPMQHAIPKWSGGGEKHCVQAGADTGNNN